MSTYRMHVKHAQILEILENPLPLGVFQIELTFPFSSSIAFATYPNCYVNHIIEYLVVCPLSWKESYRSIESVAYLLSSFSRYFLSM